jgi:hypothetical protein
MSLKVSDKPANFGQIKKASKVLPENVLQILGSGDTSKIVSSIIQNIDSMSEFLIVLNNEEEKLDNIDKASLPEVVEWVKKIWAVNGDNFSFLGLGTSQSQD